MNPTRRNFLRSSAAISAAALLACRRSGAVPQGAVSQGAGTDPEKSTSDDAAPDRKLHLLILGGTGFIGPALVEYALSRGHTVTLFNRGKSNPHLFPDVEKLRGDRDPNKGEGLKALEGRKFDVVYDDCGYFPRMVDASAALLAPNIGHYVFVSSISAYADNSVENADEDSALATMEDPTIENFGKNSEFYGPLKALCEQAAEKACPGRSTIIRPGYIVGPGDPTHRFTWWPLRVKRGGKMLVPGAATDPMQIIDVRDLARFMVRVGERKVFGAFNAVGPGSRLPMSEMLALSKKVTGSDAQFVYVPTDFLTTHATDLENTWPIWAPYEGKTKGFHTYSNARARNAGMTFTGVEDTIRDLLAWFDTLPPERQNAVKVGISAEDEAALLAKWNAKG